MIGAATALAIVALLEATPIPASSYSLSDAQWRDMCPRIVSEAQLRRRGIQFEPIERPTPRYPSTESLGPHEGIVVLDVRVDRYGRVPDARVVSTIDAWFVETSVAAIKTWRYAPPIVDGKATCLVLTVNFEFRVP